MFTRMLRLVCLAGVFVLLTSIFGTAPSAEARRSEVTLTSVQSYETKVDGRDALRIEIGMKGKNADYRASVKPFLPHQLVIDMNNAKVDGLATRYALDSRFASRLMIFQIGDKQLRLRVNANGDLTSSSYRVHTEKADRKAKKPYRLVIDIFAAGGESGSVDNVRGHEVVIDPGHGGSDTGAVGPSGLTEKEVTLAVSQKLESILENSGASVRMTRTTDVDVYGPMASAGDELQARVDEIGPRSEIFVSIHCNAFSSPVSHGMETYHFPGSVEGTRLARDLNEELEEAGGLANRGVKSANFYVLKHSSTPASLVELAFITNEEEEALLADSAYQSKLAMAIARGISRYFAGE